MSGIIGYIGQNEAQAIVLTGLKRLEFRGYNSAGLALIQDGTITIYKEKGNLAQLEKQLDGVKNQATAGLGHTCWANPSTSKLEDAHPQQSYTGRYTLVLDGTIDNMNELIDIYLANIKRESDTAAEVVAHLMDHFSGQGLNTEEALRQVLCKLEGAFALLLVDKEDPSRLYAAKYKRPLLVGIGEGEMMVASESTAMLHVTNRFKDLKDGEYVLFDRNRLVIKNMEGEAVNREAYTVEWDSSSVDTGNYEHYMLKEIDEQPAVIRELISQYYDEKGRSKLGDSLSGLVMPERIHIVACGTSYHAGLVGKRFLERIARIPTQVHIASEFLYDQILIEGKPLFIFISQSGETADTRGVLDKIKQQGYPTLTVTNVQSSTMYREADFKLLTHAGPEIAVASTKAYTAQVAVLAMLSTYLAAQKGLESPVQLIQELNAVAAAIETLVAQKEKAKAIAHTYLANQKRCFFMGRLQDYAVCLEAALKLKETSYIQAEGYASGELKHGPIALIEEGTPVFVLITQDDIAKNTRNNAEEVKARGANTCIIAREGLDQKGDTWVLPQVYPLLMPMVAIIPFQLVAYYAALERGCDVDKPRNLAKSLTSE